ncbi:TorD/DmsD family molecular chaperone [Salisediminibacterium halotolerans]|uniref:TorD/DmsD family molecular chaperone n=1 Tax=Salisediminibacterium halotolerans TaxID=517425 RepID=UPI000EAC05AD|nr:molecular chaperone TorD family protein [Salisediminibacterium halotolerans]RLJ69255.1 TorA maturation chaperone TorD [Actinophytocola xinjiangensis]RPE87010.1 TorA maturation chaperone TorD [Salisediminibacterium halotolerans]TWG32257.1 TorA maturation chaperone TorD [Salisediminibacterium halotolerans]GEL08004.1 dehydrogenase [Salisediminibacterium halotolerans]
MEPEQLGEFHYKANLFKVLSELYKEPVPEHPDWIPALNEAVAELYPELTPFAENLEKEIASYQLIEQNNSLMIDYAKLFVGPFDLFAPPYASVYLEQGRQIVGESTKKVEKFYREAGIEKAADFHQPSDHIAVELEFIYYLYYMYAETNELRYLELLQTFVTRHLQMWIFSFTDKMKNSAGETYYRMLGELTEQIANKELEAVGYPVK